MRLLLTALLVLLSWACGPEETSDVESATTPGVVQLSAAEIGAAGLRTAIAEPTSVRREIEVPASVQPPDTAQAVVGSIVEGRVVAVHVLPGDVVRAGDPLVEIHAHEVAEAQRDVRSAEAELAYRENAHGRSLELYEAGAVSREEVERRSADLEAARAELDRAQEMVEHLEPSPSGNATATAPRDGTLFQVDARMGQAVLPGTPLVRMGRTDVLWVTAFVPERAAALLAADDTVRVRFEAGEAHALAHLVRAANFVDPVTRSVEMRFELERVPAGVRPGSFALVDIASAERFEGVELPSDAVVRLGERDVVFVAEGAGAYRATPVEVLPLRDGRLAVLGLTPGLEVVIDGAYALKAELELVQEGSGESGSAP